MHIPGTMGIKYSKSQLRANDHLLCSQCLARPNQEGVFEIFTDGKKAAEYYASLGHGGTIWKTTVDKNSPPQALRVAEVREFLKKE